MAEHSHLLVEDENELPVHGQTMKGNGSQPAGRPSMESYMRPEKPAAVDDSLARHYRERCSRLEGELHDADRKIRLQVEEIMQLKRELSKDRTETLLSHQKEISELKEAHRNETELLKESHRRDAREFERQITELDRKLFKMDLEHRSGGRTTGNRILDMLEDVAPTFLENISGMLSGALAGPAQPGHPAQTELSPEQARQLRSAFEQDLNGAAKPRADKDETFPTSPQHTMTTNTSGESVDPSHRSIFEQEEAIGLNDVFAGKLNGHHEPSPEASS